MGDRAKAVEFYNQAANIINAKQPENYQQLAYQMFSSACYADPTWGEAFYWTGNNNSDLKLIHGAIACWRKALEFETRQEELGKIHTNLGWRLHCLGRYEEAIAHSLQALDLLQNSDNQSSVYINLAQMHGALFNIS